MLLCDVARQVWQEFGPRADETLTCRGDGMIEVSIAGSAEGFDVDPDKPLVPLVVQLADRIQTIVMEGRQRMVPGCPSHPGAHPLESSLVDGAAAWVCPQTAAVIRYLPVLLGGEDVDDEDQVVGALDAGRGLAGRAVAVGRRDD